MELFSASWANSGWGMGKFNSLWNGSLMIASGTLVILARIERVSEGRQYLGSIWLMVRVSIASGLMRWPSKSKMHAWTGQKLLMLDACHLQHATLHGDF